MSLISKFKDLPILKKVILIVALIVGVSFFWLPVILFLIIFPGASLYMAFENEVNYSVFNNYILDAIIPWSIFIAVALLMIFGFRHRNHKTRVQMIISAVILYATLSLLGILTGMITA